MKGRVYRLARIEIKILEGNYDATNSLLPEKKIQCTEKKVYWNGAHEHFQSIPGKPVSPGMTVKISSLDRPPQVIQSSNSFLQKLHRKHQSNSFKTVCAEIKGDQDELQPIISAYLKALHISFPKADLSAAFIIHNRKAHINQRLFFLYCSTPTLLPAVNGIELRGEKKNK